MRNKSTRKSSLDTFSMPRQKEAHPPVQRISASLAYVALVLRPTSSTSKWRTLKVRKTQINTQLFLRHWHNEIRTSHKGRVDRYPAGTATDVHLGQPIFIHSFPLKVQGTIQFNLKSFTKPFSNTVLMTANGRMKFFKSKINFPSTNCFKCVDVDNSKKLSCQVCPVELCPLVLIL